MDCLPGGRYPGSAKRTAILMRSTLSEMINSKRVECFLGRPDFLASVVVIPVVALGVNHEIFRGSGAVVDHGEGKVGSRVADGSPDVDELVALLEEGICFFLGSDMSPDSGLGSFGCLINVDLLDRLAGGAGVVPADGVVKDLDALDLLAAVLESFSQEGFHLGVVFGADGLVVLEIFWGGGGGGAVDCEAGYVDVGTKGANFGVDVQAVGKVGDVLGDGFTAVRGVVDVDFGPWRYTSGDAGWVEVAEGTAGHFAGCDLSEEFL
ncbi:hypothetical protein QC763_100040 [Podospora pseudopauciseta]|uniref:Uncharacterized protein n=2 Tax=Podospora TaxID=5144 RepID=A0ABR0HVR0_9PEZI|nr:hypothetical protein QC763_100040 [Podospora pseudopauciseta]KAK4680687.1 hypothetical protein QC764_0001320 [Podospora pseudoanserina]